MIFAGHSSASERKKETNEKRKRKRDLIFPGVRQKFQHHHPISSSSVCERSVETEPESQTTLREDRKGKRRILHELLMMIMMSGRCKVYLVSDSGYYSFVMGWVLLEP